MHMLLPDCTCALLDKQIGEHCFSEITFIALVVYSAMLSLVLVVFFGGGHILISILFSDALLILQNRFFIRNKAVIANLIVLD